MTKKLELKKETLRCLSEDEMALAAGGTSTASVVTSIIATVSLTVSGASTCCPTKTLLSLTPTINPGTGTFHQ